MISCGKSSFLNFLLGMNCLENGNDVVTKCVVIIRHNKDLELNERYIYSVNINERNEGFYDFDKDEKTKSDDLNRIIKERNDLIRNSEETKMPKKEDFFLIIEANIPLFRGKNSKFGDFFEFLDLPGLDEGLDDSKSYKSSNFFKEKILPKIVYNSLFSILIFDAGKYMRDENPITFKKYLDTYFLKDYSNSFFILNKVDLMDNKEAEKKLFETEMLVNKLKINLENKTIHIQYLSCRNLTNEVKRKENFQSYLKYLLTEGDIKKKTNLSKFLKEKMLEEFNLTEISNESPNNEQKNDIIAKIRELKEEKSNFTSFLNIKEYFNYSKAFDELKGKLKEKKEKDIQHKIEKYKELYEDFNKSFTDSFNKFLNNSNEKEMANRIKAIVKSLDKISKENKDNIIKTQKYIDLLYKNLNSKIELSLEQFQNLKPIIEKLYKKGKSLSTFENLKEEYELIDFFIKKDKKLRIPFFGGYSTGKSSILNCIIGKKILPEGNQVTTRRIIVIRNNDKNKYTLSKTNFVETNEDYCCFEDGEKVIPDCDDTNYENIYKFLEKENANEKNENMFYLLTAPIFLFKKMKLSKEILNKIELIDFPGIDVNEEIISEIFNKLIQLSDTFTFVNECKLIKNKDNIRIIQRIVNRIDSRKFNFDYNSCLFVLNKADEDGKNINIENKKREFEEILFGGNQIQNNSFFDFFKKRENPEISIAVFSCQYFFKYLSYYDDLKNFENYIDKNINEIQQDSEDDDLIEKLEEKLQEKLIIDFKDCENKKVELNDGYLSKLKVCLMNKGISLNEINSKSENLNNILKSYIIMINNLEENLFYINSKASSFIDDLEKKFIIAKDMTEKQYDEKIKKFINTLQKVFRLLQQKSINKKVYEISEVKKKFEIKKEELLSKYKNYYSLINNKIDFIYNNLLNKVKDLIILGNSEETKVLELKKKIEEFKNYYEKEVKALDDFVKEKIFTFQYELDKKIISQLNDYAIVRTKEEISYWKLGLATITGSIIAIPGTAFLLIGGIIMFVVGAVQNLIYLIKGNKNSLIEKLNDLLKEINIQKDSSIYKCNKIMYITMKNAIGNLMIIYDIQISQLNEKEIQEIYEEFVHAIGDKYIGEKKDDKKHGYGIYYWFDGSKYEGYYKNGLREGYGKMKWIEGGKYEGYWIKNEREGYGKIIFSNKNIYEGQYKNSHENGFGIFTWDDGDKYIGDFKDDSFEGIGILNYFNGNRYEGEFKKGRSNGIGSYYYSNGKKYEGEWEDYKKNGKGIFYLSNNEKYEGFWKDNRKILDNYIEDQGYIKKKLFIEPNKIKIEYIDGDIYEGEYNPKTKIIEGYGNYYFKKLLESLKMEKWMVNQKLFSKMEIF